MNGRPGYARMSSTFMEFHAGRPNIGVSVVREKQSCLTEIFEATQR